ncbi:IS110 family transposase [Paracoccus sp. MC1854]|nr:IS110 family transposase [Paracoccus sp. MC1854]
MEAAMTNATATTGLVCTVAVELARSRWVVGILPPKSSKVAIQAVAGGNAQGLLGLLQRIRNQLERQHAAQVELRICYECGYDGFWLARFLKNHGIDVYVLDPSSFLVSRRGRRAKTDRIDAEAMAFKLRAYLNGDESVFRMVAIPTPEAEDARRISRERTRLVSERTRHVNRIRALLALHGIRGIKGLFGGAWREQLDASRTGDGRPLGRFLKAEIAREFERLALVREQMQALDAERTETLADPATPFPQREKVELLKQLSGVGELSATLMVSEVFHRSFANRRHLASFLGLAPTPYASGDDMRDQGISKAGNKHARTLLVEIAWSWLRHQPNSDLAAWYRRRFAQTGARGRKVGIVALARKLAIALWRFVEHGLVPSGARLKA